MNRDDLYAMKTDVIGDFRFDDAVADVFPDMISRSVPGYASILAMISELSGKYAKAGTNIVDLGCSLGAATLLMRKRVPADCTILAVDSSAAMAGRLRETVLDLDNAEQGSGDSCKIVVLEDDIRSVQLNKTSSFAVLNLTLQFIPKHERCFVLNKVYSSLIPGGALLLAEKVCFKDPRKQELLTELHHDFKRSHGYSDLEIAQKRTAIENRLIPETLEEHVQRLRDCGFATIVPWFQCFNFVSVLAVKE